MAETLGLPTASILSWARSGLLSPRRDERGFYVFSFQDISLLRTARELVAADVSPRRVRKALESLRAQLPVGRPLSALRLAASGGHVLVRDEGRTWEPDTGQIHLELELRTPTSSAVSTARPGSFAQEGPAQPTADAWYERGLDLEVESAALAMEAYRRALALEPTHGDAHVNLGRLLHEEGSLASAEAHYREAVAADPDNARALYNLGVALEDQGRTAAAVEAYEGALDLDADLAAAHFNLSRLYEATGRAEDALRHLAGYKRILDRAPQGT